MKPLRAVVELLPGDYGAGHPPHEAASDNTITVQ